MLSVLKHSEQVLFTETGAHPLLLLQRMAYTNIASISIKGSCHSCILKRGKLQLCVTASSNSGAVTEAFSFENFKAQSQKGKCKIFSLSKRNQTISQSTNTNLCEFLCLLSTNKI